jgi:hypothetical protein
LLRVLDRIPEGPILFEETDKAGEHFTRALAETFPIVIDPLTLAAWQEIAFV